MYNTYNMPNSEVNKHDFKGILVLVLSDLWRVAIIPLYAF